MTRVFLAIDQSDLDVLRNVGEIAAQRVSGLPAFTVTEEWKQSQPDQDEEVLADELLQLASMQGHRFVIAADLSGSQFVVTDPAAARITFAEALVKAQVAAYFSINDAGEALWFDASELNELLASGES